MRPTRMSSTRTRMQTPERLCLPAGPDWDVDVVCDLPVGGVWSIRSAPPDGAAYRETNRFTLVDRPRRLAFESALTMPDGSTLRKGLRYASTRVVDSSML